jgi:hypothetical protein
MGLRGLPSQMEIDMAEEKDRQRTLNSVGSSIVDAFKIREQGAKTKRQEGLKKLGLAAKLGVSVKEIDASLEPKKEQSFFSKMMGEELPPQEERPDITRNVRAEAEQKRSESEAKVKAARNKPIGDIRKEISGLGATKETLVVDAALGKIQSSLKAKSAAGDLAGVFSFMKILDPNSVVREGEFANAARAAGMSDRAVNIFRKVDKGTILTPSQRLDFEKISKEQAQAQFETFKAATAPQRATVTAQGLPMEQVFPQFANLGKKKQIKVQNKVQSMTPEQRAARIEELEAKRGK